MATRGDMKNRIAGEMHISATDFASEISDAISSAVAHYRSKSFWFKEGTATFGASLTAMYSLATVLPAGIEIDSIKVWSNGSPYTITPKSWKSLEDSDSSLLTGLPSNYAIHHQMLRLFPTPSTTLSVEVSYIAGATLTASDSATGVWTNEGEELIRLHAKADLYENVIQDMEKSDRMKVREVQVLDTLEEETIKRLGLGNIDPYL